MAENKRNLDKFKNTQTVKVILLFNQSLSILSRVNLKPEIFLLEVYKL